VISAMHFECFPARTFRLEFPRLMDLFVRPEVERRQTEGRLPKPATLFAAQVIMFPDGRPVRVRLNQEVRCRASSNASVSLAFSRAVYGLRRSLLRIEPANCMCLFKWGALCCGTLRLVKVRYGSGELVDVRQR
jgi:hypothetical protein